MPYVIPKARTGDEKTEPRDLTAAEIDALQELNERAQDAVEADEYDTAITLWLDALGRLPEPRAWFSAAMICYQGIADAAWLADDYPTAIAAAKEALDSADGLRDPLNWLRLGQSEYASGDQRQGLEDLLNAYTFGGEEIFADGDEEWLDLLKDRGLV